MFGRIAPGPRPAAYLIALLIALGRSRRARRRRLRRGGPGSRRRPVRRSATREVPRHAAGAEGRPRGAHSQGARRRQGAGEPRVPEASRRQAGRLRAEAARRDTGRIGPVALRHGVQRHDRRRAARSAGRDPAASERRLGDGDIRARTGARREPGAARPADALERAAVEPARRRERRPRRADRLRRQRTASVLQRRRLHRASRLPEGAARLRWRPHRPLRRDLREQQGDRRQRLRVPGEHHGHAVGAGLAARDARRRDHGRQERHLQLHLRRHRVPAAVLGDGAGRLHHELPPRRRLGRVPRRDRRCRRRPGGRTEHQPRPQPLAHHRSRARPRSATRSTRPRMRA